MREAHRWVSLGALAAVSLVAIAPALVQGQPLTDSGVYDQVWTGQFADGLARGELYPRWLPRSFGGFGSPTFWFYPPLAFYLTSSIRLLGASVEQSVTLAEGVICFLSGVAMLAWLRGRGATWRTFWACVYAVAPYHMIDLHVRGDLAELGAFIWPPLICLAIDNRSWPALAFAYAGLIVTHLPMAVLAGPFLVAPLALVDRKALPAVAIGCGMGMLIAAAYLMPALSLQRFIDVRLLWTPYYTASDWSLLVPGEGQHRTYLVGFGAAAVAGSLALWLARPRVHWLLVVALSGVCGLGLAPIWSLPILRDVQFPWRLFGLFEFAVIAALAEWRNPAPRLAVLGAIVIASIPGVLLLAGGMAVSYAGHPSAAAIARADDAPEYLPPRPHAGATDRLHAVVDPATIGVRPLRSEIAEAARPVVASASLVSLVALLASGLAWRSRCRPRRVGRPAAAEG